MRTGDSLRSALNASVLFIHHSNKANATEERGSSHLRGAADMMAVLTKTKAGLTLRCQKSKDYPDFPNITVALHPFRESCVVIPSSAKEAQFVGAKRPGLPERAQAALSTLVRAGGVLG